MKATVGNYNVQLCLRTTDLNNFPKVPQIEQGEQVGWPVGHPRPTVCQEKHQLLSWPRIQQMACTIKKIKHYDSSKNNECREFFMKKVTDGLLF